MVSRRGALLAMAALGLPGLAVTQRLPRVGYLFSFTRLEGEHLWAACQDGLRDYGYVQGRNVVLEPRWAEGHHDRLPLLVSDLVKSRVDVIVAAATPANLAAKAGAGSIPIVMVGVGDPVKVGLIANLRRPGGNITGLALLTRDLAGKRLQLARDLVGSVKTAGVLLNPANRVHDVFLEETRTAALALSITLVIREARDAADLGRAFDFTAGVRPDAVVVFDDPVLWSFRREIVARAAQARLPVIYGYAEFVDEGGLASLGPDRPDHYRRTARYVDSILKGVKPAELPVEQPTKFQLVVNSATARTLGIRLPPTLLLRVDRIVQ